MFAESAAVFSSKRSILSGARQAVNLCCRSVFVGSSYNRRRRCRCWRQLKQFQLSMRGSLCIGRLEAKLEWLSHKQNSGGVLSFLAAGKWHLFSRLLVECV